MILRVFLALIGAIVITSTLLLGMDTLTSMFRERDGQRYYRITDILPRPAPGRPERPLPPPRRPDAPLAEVELPASGLPADAPTDFEPAPDSPQPLLDLNLDATGDADDADLR